MRHIYFTLNIVIFIFHNGYSQVCTTCSSNCASGCTTTYSVSSSTDWTPANDGDKLCITGGTYTGDINFAKNATVCVSGTAAFNPTSLDASLSKTGTIQIGSSATATFGTISFGSSRSLVINNCGSVTHTGDMTRTGNGTFTYNNSGTLNFGTKTFDFSGTSGANVFCNNGTVTGGTLAFQGTLTNYAAGTITLTTLTSSGGGDVTNNFGVITVSGTTTMSGGGTMNACDGGRISTGNLDLSGSSKLGCSGTCGQIQISGTSTFTGTSGATGTIDICDASGVALGRTGTSADPKVDSNSGTTVFAGTVGYCTCASVLPIKLINFTADCNTGKVNLHWSTATETNNDYFTIERANDAITYTTIGVVDSKATNGNSMQPLTYEFIDYSIPQEEGYNKVFYYRLKQTDLDGHYTYSEIQPAGCSPYCIKDITVTNEDNNVYIKIMSVCSTTLDISLFDALGQVVGAKREFIGAGENRLQLNTNNIASGLYILRAGTINQNFTEKFNKQ